MNHYQIKRRALLRLTTALAGASILNSCTASPILPVPTLTVSSPVPKSAYECDVLIIGAGIAGLAAAQTLQRAGKQVILLEARMRAGGRIWTSDKWATVPVDLGASWIHGTTGNPLMKVLEREGITTVATDYDNIVVYDQAGIRLNDDTYLRLSDDLASVLEDAIAVGNTLDADTTLQHGIDTALAGRRGRNVPLEPLQYALNATIEHEFAADANELSLWWWDEGEPIRGRDVLFPGGYAQLVQSLAQGLDIRLGEVVSNVEYTPEDGVRVKTATHLFNARHVIVTLPLGVLKSNTVQFSPALPETKQIAINRLGMGVLDKLFLRFETVFWDTDHELIGYVDTHKGRWAEFLNIAYYTGTPVLLGFNAATYAKHLSTRTDTEIVADAMAVLRTIYGGSIPDPKGVQLTRWGKDPYSLGSYSFLSPGATPEDRKQLGLPVGKLLYFAGEATAEDYPATVHGAYLSGERAAEMLLSQV